MLAYSALMCIVLPAVNLQHISLLKKHCVHLFMLLVLDADVHLVCISLFNI